jgi:hypothetical protein
MNVAMSKVRALACVPLLTWLLFFSPLANAQSAELDKYGGAKALKCAKATGWFHTEKIGSQWWLCTPLGNAFFMNGMEQVIGGDNTYSAAMQRKYGSTQSWTQATNRRLLAWGFNALATGSYFGNMPFAAESAYPLDSNGQRSQPVKMPFMLSIRPALYAMTNPAIWNGSSSQRLLTAPVKNMIYGHSPFYTGYVASGGIADYYDSGIANWMQKDLQVDFLWAMIKNSPYLNYLIGITSDDGDETNGFGNSPDFPTVPPGYNNYNLGMQVAAMSPVQTANSGLGSVYADTSVHTKQALRDFLKSKYKSVAALNAAWGSNYTTFDSSGVQISGEVIAAGDGGTLTFSHTFAHPAVSKLSVHVLVNGVAVAGATPNGDLFGADVAGHVDDSAGKLTVVFSAGHAPAAGASITVSYTQNGWGTGTGFLDEDDRPVHQKWMGTDWVGMTNANPVVKADMNAFLGQMAAQYFQTCQTQLKAAFPKIMYFGPDSLSTWGGPPPAPVLQAAGQYLDAFVTASSNVFTQAEMDFIEQNFGDKPYFGSFYSTANPDSALSANPNTTGPSGFTTQTARGQGYYNAMMQMLQVAHTTAGNFPYIGTLWWQYIDNYSEKLNWGLVTHLDNAYDGHEATPATVPCSAPLSNYTCGGEQRNYGDVVTWVTKANRLWLAHAESPAGGRRQP